MIFIYGFGGVAFFALSLLLVSFAEGLRRSSQ
jgi:hypothetical protein